MTASALKSLTLGFMPLLDCALLVVAAEKGFAESNGLALHLVRESSWANIRDRVAVGHFDAAHMLGPMVVAESLGAGQLAVPMVAPVALGRGGNAVTVSRSLWASMVEAGATLGAAPAVQGAALARVVAQRRGGQKAPLTLAMVFPFSCHNYELRYWLAAAGIDPELDVRLVVLPPPLLVDALRTGQVDGFCVGEPWNSIAVDAGLGAIVTCATDIWERAPEKVLGMQREFAERHPDLVDALVRSIQCASAWIDDPDHHAELVQLLSEPRYVGAPAELMKAALRGSLRLVGDQPPVEKPGFLSLGGTDANVPWTEHAAWYYSQMLRWRQISAAADKRERAVQSFRPDLYFRALGGATQVLAPALSERARMGAFFDTRAPVALHAKA